MTSLSSVSRRESVNRTPQIVRNCWNKWKVHCFSARDALRNPGVVSLPLSKFLNLLEVLKPSIDNLRTLQLRQDVIDELHDLEATRKKYQKEHCFFVVTALGDIQEDRTIPPRLEMRNEDQLDGLVNHNGFLFTPEAFEEYDSQLRRYPTKEILAKIYPYIRDNDLFGWAHVEDGCYARADLSCFMLTLFGISANYLSKRYVILDKPLSRERHNYHVAAEAKPLDGEVQELDFITKTKPTTKDEWILGQLNRLKIIDDIERVEDDQFEQVVEHGLTFTAPVDTVLTSSTKKRLPDGSLEIGVSQEKITKASRFSNYDTLAEYRSELEGRELDSTISALEEAQVDQLLADLKEDLENARENVKPFVESLTDSAVIDKLKKGIEEIHEERASSARECCVPVFVNAGDIAEGILPDIVYAREEDLDSYLYWNGFYYSATTKTQIRTPIRQEMADLIEAYKDHPFYPKGLENAHAASADYFVQFLRVMGYDDEVLGKKVVCIPDEDGMKFREAAAVRLGSKWAILDPELSSKPLSTEDWVRLQISQPILFEDYGEMNCEEFTYEDSGKAIVFQNDGNFTLLRNEDYVVNRGIRKVSQINLLTDGGEKRMDFARQLMEERIQDELQIFDDIVSWTE